MKIDLFSIKSGFCSPLQILFHELEKANSMKEEEVDLSSEEAIVEDELPFFTLTRMDMPSIDGMLERFSRARNRDLPTHSNFPVVEAIFPLVQLMPFFPRVQV